MVFVRVACRWRHRVIVGCRVDVVAGHVQKGNPRLCGVPLSESRVLGLRPSPTRNASISPTIALISRRSPSELGHMSSLARVCSRIHHGSQLRHYATVGSKTYVGRPPNPPPGAMIPPSVVSSPSWDARVLANIDDSSTSFLKLVDQYVDRSGTVLDVPLPYESRPTSGRRVQFDASDNGVFMISHALRHESQHRVTVCSGFALNVAQTSDHSDSPMIVSCAHTLEEVSILHTLRL